MPTIVSALLADRSTSQMTSAQSSQRPCSAAFGLVLVSASALLLACGSGGESGAKVEGSGGSTQSASGGVTASGGTSAGGQSSTSGGTASSNGGTASSNGGTASSNGGTNGGVSGAGTAAGGSSGASAGRSSGGASGSGGAPNSAGQSGSAPNGSAGNGGAASSAGCPGAGWKLVWGDDFDGASGTAANSGNWAYDTGPNWYNGELQDYTSGTTNASLDGKGNLVIEARKEAREGREYTSARLKTEGKKAFTRGRFEGRMKLPYGQGMWPAFWMLGGNSWPDTGEIDIMENLGREPSLVHGTMHGPGYSAAAGPTASYTLPGNAKFSDDFHVFAIEWENNAIRWYVDETLYSTKTPSDISGKTWVYDHDFFIILNLAVGGEWPGNPDNTTVFPQKLLIDYVRVCQK